MTIPRAKWARVKILEGYEHVLFVGWWEWRVNGITGMLGASDACLLGSPPPAWCARGPGLGTGSATASDSVFTVTLRQAKARCEDAALRLLEKCAADLGLRVVEERKR